MKKRKRDWLRTITSTPTFAYLLDDDHLKRAEIYKLFVLVKK